MASCSLHTRFPYANNMMNNLSSGRDEVDGMIDVDCEQTTVPAPTFNTISSICPGNKSASQPTCSQKYCSKWPGNREHEQFRLNEAVTASVMCKQSCHSSSALKEKEIDPEFAAVGSVQSCLCKGSGSIPIDSRIQVTSTSDQSAALKTTNAVPDNHFVSKCTQAKASNTSESTTMKKVQWADNIEEIMTDDIEYEQHRSVLLALRIPEGSKNSTVDAVRFMLSDPGSDNGCSESETLITLATSMLWIKLNRPPTVKELYSAILDADCKEKPIVTAFIQEYQTQRGKDILSSLLNASTDDQRHLQQQHTHHHQQPHHHKQQPDHQQQQQQISDCSSSISTITDSHPLPSTDVSSSESEIFTSSSLPSLKDSDLQSLPLEYKDQPRDSVKHTFSRDIAINALKKEHESLKKIFTCVKCQVQPTEVLFLPCGHVSLCALCSDKCNVCPVCNKLVLGEVKIYFG